MLSESTIDNLVQPIVTRQENINSYVLTKIAKRVKIIGELSPSDIDRMKLLVDYGIDIREMNSQIKKMSDKQVKDIKSLIQKIFN